MVDIIKVEKPLPCLTDFAMEVKSEISSSGAGGQFELLDMLAEVASQELQNEGRGVPASGSKIPPKSKAGNPRNKRKSLVDYDSFDVGQIKRMSQVSLLKLFAEQVCHEVHTW